MIFESMVTYQNLISSSLLISFSLSRAQISNLDFLFLNLKDHLVMGLVLRIHHPLSYLLTVVVHGKELELPFQQKAGHFGQHGQAFRGLGFESLSNCKASFFRYHLKPGEPTRFKSNINYFTHSFKGVFGWMK